MEEAVQVLTTGAGWPVPPPTHAAMPDFLPLDTRGVLQLSANDFVSKRTLVLGQSGSGKSNAEAVIMEGLLAQGLPMTIIVLANSDVFFVSGQTSLSKSTA
jgi:polynucleotide 5'-kinase involved in rRNA processing